MNKTKILIYLIILSVIIGLSFIVFGVILEASDIVTVGVIFLLIESLLIIIEARDV